MTDQTPLADYMKGGEKNFLELARRLELSYEATLGLKTYADELGIEFSSSPFDVPSCEFLGTIGLRRLKIPSGETVNPYILKAAAKTRLPLIVSSGMMTLEELDWALSLLREHGSGPVTVLHCTTQYPAEPRFSNLNAMATIARRFGVPVGYSDHTPGIEVSLAAVALGACVIEKHFTLDKTLPGPDQAGLARARRAHGTRARHSHDQFGVGRWSEEAISRGDRDREGRTQVSGGRACTACGYRFAGKGPGRQAAWHRDSSHAARCRAGTHLAAGLEAR